VAKAYKKRVSHTEEATIPGYISLVSFCPWSYYNLTVGMIFCFCFSCVTLILELPVRGRWSCSRE